MTYLLRYVLDHPMPVIFVAVIVLLGGVYSLMNMPVDLFPNLEVPVVNIITHYPAASSQDIDLLVSRPIGEQMRAISGVTRVASTSIQGISQVTVEFTWGTGVSIARQDVQSRLSQLSGTLPQGVVPRLESVGTNLQEVAGYVIYGGTDQITLRTIAQYDLTGRLMEVSGVFFVEVLGGDRRAFNVNLKSEKLIAAKLTVDDVVTVLSKDNQVNIAGYIDRSSREFLVRGNSLFESLDDIRSLSITGSGRDSIPLDSIAQVSQGVVSRHYVVHGDGVPAVAVVIHKQPGANTINVVDGVKKVMSDLGSLFPAGTEIKMYYNQSEIISEARSEILHGLLIGMFLAVLVLYSFLGQLRPTLIVAATIPISLAATLAIMGLFGLSFNVITMSALTLAVGMVVDDSVIVAENIFRRRRQGFDKRESSLWGTLEIFGPDVSGTLTTVAAFLPLILITGIAALFLKPFGLTISTALLASLVMSLSLVPMLFSKVVAEKPASDFTGSRIIGALQKVNGKILKFSLDHRWLVLLVVLILVAVSVELILLSKGSLLPPVDEGAILIEYVTPPGTSLAESNRIGDMLDRIALADQDVTCVYRRTGSPEVGYQVEGVNKGEIEMKLRNKSQRRRSVDEIMAALRKSYSQFEAVVFLYHQPTQEKMDESFSAIPALFGVTIYGTDTAMLISLGSQIEDILVKDPAVTNVVNNTKVKSPGMDVKIDHTKAAQYGVDIGNVLNTVHAAGLGVEATRIIRQKQDIAVIVKLDGYEMQTKADLSNLPIITKNGDIVPLSKAADIETHYVPSSISRLNGRREITLLTDVRGSISSLVSRLRNKFGSIKLPEGYSIDFTGEYKILSRTIKETAFVLLSALLLIYLIMAIQFHSWLEPLVILFTVPLSLVGASILLFLTGRGFDVSVGAGAITLVGISVNNAIVLVDYFNRGRLGGKDISESLFYACSIRLRPILMTALTTIFALIPIAIGTAGHSSVFQPFAITVIGGLITATFATLIVIPVLTTFVAGRVSSLNHEKE
jgi:HAE1 family hydrophobic/amphiphilic exporter-1